MAETVILNIHQMIDLSIGTPENGVVDFNMLQALLHCMAQQMRVQSKNVELKSNVGVLPVSRPMEGAPTMAISEFTLETDGKPAVTQDNTQDTILVVERAVRGPGGAGPVVPPPPKKIKVGLSGGAPSGGGGGGGSSGGGGAVSPSGGAPIEDDEEVHDAAVVVGSQGVQMSLVTLSKFNLLAGMVNDLQNRVYGTIPTNEDILETVRSQTNIQAITDMWTNLNVSSRLQAAEEAINKLSSLLQDIITSSETLRTVTVTTTQGQGVPGLSGSTEQIGSAGQTLRSVVGPPLSYAGPVGSGGPASELSGPPGQGPGRPQGPVVGERGTAAELAIHSLNADVMKKDLAMLLDALKELRNDHEILLTSYENAMKGINVTTDIQKSSPKILTLGSLATGMQTSTGIQPSSGQTGQSIGGQMGQSVGGQMGQSVGGQMGQSVGGQPGRDGFDSVADANLAVMNSQIGGIQEKLAALQNQVNSIQNQMVPFLKNAVGPDGKPLQFMTTTDNAGGLGQLSPDLARDIQGLMQLFQTVQTMQDQLQHVHDTAVQLAAEREDKQLSIKSLLEQIELLKAIKLDREDMVEALADKADLRLLARKVSHDQFEMACDDLSKAFELAMGKLGVQETIWQQALDDIQREIETKLDKIELGPVKEFFNTKLRQLQENLKQMADLRREAHAAGTKRKLLMDVNCISCDANAVMETQNIVGGGPKPLPTHMSMKPYLTYELDAIRKSQQSNLPQRNMHDWENIQKTPQKQPLKVRSEAQKHLCNRYCGGSHTMTTPAQRVARLGHFIKQWGPEVLPLSSEFATGDDGRLYKVTASKLPQDSGPGGAADFSCDLKLKKSRESQKRSSSSSDECRCLEDRTKK